MSIRATGTVARLYVRQELTYIKLAIPAASAPKEELFTLRMDHPNYNAQFSLVLAAAANRWPLTIRIVGDADIAPEREANVNYLVVDWE